MQMIRSFDIAYFTFYSCTYCTGMSVNISVKQTDAQPLPPPKKKEITSFLISDIGIYG